MHVVATPTVTVYLVLWLTVMVWVELVVVAMAPDKGVGVVLIVYMAFPPFGGGVHSMVTVDCSTPWTELSTLISLGAPAGKNWSVML